MISFSNPTFGSLRVKGGDNSRPGQPTTRIKQKKKDEAKPDGSKGSGADKPNKN
ncbi:MAG: hypothetical protein AB7P76_03730 [Candidatus Melainabacteria bacterium]